MIEAIRQVGLYERFDFVVVDKDNKIVTRQKNKQDAKEFVGLANSKFFKNTTMGKKYKKPFKVYPINRGDRRKIGIQLLQSVN